MLQQTKSQWKKWIAPVASLALVMSLSLAQSKADDAAAATSGKATVTVTVVDDAGKPVSGATVAILPAPAKKGKAAAAAAAPTSQPAEGGKAARPQPLESGVTGADGTFALTKIANGEFMVTARLKGTGNGRMKVTVADDKDATVSVTLKAPKAKN
jgi:hypothetical protein